MKIDLSENGFTCQISSSIGELSLLRELYLSHNVLTGNIPSEIGNLKWAQKISMSSNNIKGTIPSEIRKLTNLILLHLHGNRITGGADYIEMPIKSYITDCGKTFINEALVKYKICIEYCTSNGDCLKVQNT